MNDRSEKVRAKRGNFIFASLLGAFALALIVQLVHLTVVVPSGRSGEFVLPEVQRGSILDRQGRSRGDHAHAARLRVDADRDRPQRDRRDPRAGPRHGRLRGVGHDQAARRVCRHQTADQRRAIRRNPEGQIQGKLAGVRLEDDFSRLYPQGRLASHIVGYVGSDSVPLDGIEYTFNNELAPQPVSTDSETVYGDQVFLTIDVDLQYITDSAARAAMEEDKPDAVNVLVMDAKTGEILAYTCLPDFDPNEFQKDSPKIDPNALVNRR